MRADNVFKAARRVEFGILAGHDLEAALGELSEAVGADGAVIVAEGDRPSAVTSASIREGVAEYVRGDCPPDPRESRVVVGASAGFAVDFDHFTSDELASDPFYQEFLRRHGVAWHAAAWLGETPSDRADICLSIKRSPQAGPFEADEIALLDRVLEPLRAAMALRPAVWLAQTRLIGSHLEGFSGAAVWFDERYRAVSRTENFNIIACGALLIAGPRLLAGKSEQQPALDRALSAVSRQGRASRLVLEARDGGRVMVEFRPLGESSSVLFPGVRAVALLRPLQHRSEPEPSLIALLQQAFGLTGAEARLAAFMVCGWPVAEVAERLAIGRGTARNHLKAIYLKTGTSGQAELVALLSNLR